MMHGECQGKTSSPPSWALYTVTLLRALRRFNPGVTISDVQEQNPIHRVADMFVDDCDLWTELATDATEEELVESFRKAAQSWERFLFTSGGLLALHKCYWWMIAWDWSQGLPRPCETEVDEHELSLSNGTNPALIPIKRLELDEANIAPGLRLAPSGNQECEIKHRVKMVTAMASRLNAVSLNHTEVWLFYRSIFIPKVFYLCKITALRCSEWNAILRPITSSLVCKMGFNRHTSRAIVFGPPRLGGIGLVHGYGQQGSERIIHFLSHVRDGSDVGKMMLNTLSHLQLFSGQLIGLLENPQPLPVVRLCKGQNLYRWRHLGRG